MDIVKIPNHLKNSLFHLVTDRPDFLGVYSDYDGILTFLSKIWPLHSMPSQDSRFSTALDDARQHLVNNSDWDYAYTFLNRFSLVDGDDEYFNKFINTVVSPDVRKSQDDILRYVEDINRLLIPGGYRMVLNDYFEALPVFILGTHQQDDLPLTIGANTIPFYKSGARIEQYPCFIVIYDRWNDYNIKTQVHLRYCTSPAEASEYITVKIMRKGSVHTWETLPDKFYQLDADFCSVGPDREYYITLRRMFPKTYQSILLSLRDAALFPKIAELFENDSTYKISLMRENTTERNARTIRFDLNGIDYSQAFKFNYSFQPPYAANTVVLNFDFQYEGVIEHRVYGLIGKNGTGKTQILSSIVRSLNDNDNGAISPKKPLYGKIFTISYSFFDRFDTPAGNAAFNYVYCGLKKPGGGWLSELELKMRFYESVEKIIDKGEIDNWKALLETFIPQEIVGIMFGRDRYRHTEYYRDRFSEVYSQVSSGQNILLFVITEIVAQIRYNSLILYDEPETHLHPNAISELMNMIFELVQRYDSFCIIATHSPLVIQELQCRNIYVIEREENYVIARKLEKEPFGENLTVITDEIFGNREIKRHYTTFLKGLVASGRTFEDIIDLLETDDVPLSLNTRLHIKGIIAAGYEEL